MSLENNLNQLGLEEKEAKVYLAALELGPTNIQNLTKKSEIKRSTLYEIIRNLKEQSLITEGLKGKRKIFIAAEPENLKRNIKLKEQLLNDILPELKSLNNIGFVKPKITFYEGREELREIYHDTLTTKNKIAYWISPIQSITETVGEDFLNRYVEERTKKGIWAKSIHITSKKAPYKYLEPQFHEKTLRKMRFTPAEINISNTIAIWDDKVAIMSSQREGFGFIVESKEYTTTMKIFHGLLWDISKTWEETFKDEKNSLAQKPQKASEEDIYY